MGCWLWSRKLDCDNLESKRIFNPESQQKKFDKDLLYIKKWIPNFEENNYIKKIVEHKFARERCLNTYKKALNK